MAGRCGHTRHLARLSDTRPVCHPGPVAVVPAVSAGRRFQDATSSVPSLGCPWSENETSAGQAAASAGAAALADLVCADGELAGWGQELAGIGIQGLDGDLVAEAFQAADVVAGLAAGVHALLVVVSAEVLVAGGGVR